MFIGNYSASVSKSHRVAVPKRFRSELGKSFIVAKWYEHCLVLVSEQGWKQLFERVTGSRKTLTSPVRDIDRFLLGSAYELTPDGQGRVVVPENLATYAGFSTELVFLGLNDRIEIWDAAEWKKREHYVTEHAANLL